ncbi:MAG TPA: helix-turn-helix domain-containing protein [Pseudonocardiaceae bacterium]|nr:helix-turn-helix domain-containing protein [Pseudonocardiaceae bacterium]
MADERPLRADAARNRAKILGAARAQITRHGPEVSMDAIAEAAGVAVGTLYRHYPDKTALVGAVLAEHMAELARFTEEAQARVVAGADAMAELRELIYAVIEQAARDAAVKAAAQRFGADVAGQPGEERAAAALQRLIDAAKAGGQLHPDVTIDDFIMLLATVPLDAPAETRARWLALVMPGLTTAGRPPG